MTACTCMSTAARDFFFFFFQELLQPYLTLPSFVLVEIFRVGSRKEPTWSLCERDHSVRGFVLHYPSSLWCFILSTEWWTVNVVLHMKAGVLYLLMRRTDLFLTWMSSLIALCIEGYCFVMFRNSDWRRRAPEFIIGQCFLNNDAMETGKTLMNRPCWTGRGVYGSGWMLMVEGWNTWAVYNAPREPCSLQIYLQESSRHQLCCFPACLLLIFCSYWLKAAGTPINSALNYNYTSGVNH